jgi:hypothetical protein
VTAAVCVVVVTILAGVATLSLSEDRGARPVGPAVELRQRLLDPKAWDEPAARFLAGANPKGSDLVGLWRIRGSDDAWLMLLGADGYWSTTNGWDLFGRGDVGNRGTWSLRAGRITLQGQEGFLGKGFQQVLDVALMPDGSLHEVTLPTAGRCGTGVPCAPDDQPERFVFDRVAPGTSRLLTILTSAPSTLLPADAAYLTLRGVWVTGDDWVVTINDEDQFRAFHASGDPSAEPDDTGQVELDSHGHLTITCRNGAVSAQVELARSEAVTGLLPSGVRMRSTSEHARCPSGLGGVLEWIRVSGRA